MMGMRGSRRLAGEPAERPGSVRASSPTLSGRGRSKRLRSRYPSPGRCLTGAAAHNPCRGTQSFKPRGGGLGLALATLACGLLALLASLLLSAAPASAAVTHELLSGLSGKLSEGAPVGCGVQPPLAEPPCVSGPSAFGQSGLAVTGKDVWVVDAARLEGVGILPRVDRFDAETGAFVAPQIDQPEGLPELVAPVGVGKAFSGEQVYVDAVPDVAVFDASTGKLDGTWTGARTASGRFRGESPGLTVDSSSNIADPNVGDVFVATHPFANPEGNVVDVFSIKKAEEEGLKAGEEPVPVTELNGTCENVGEVLPCPGHLVAFAGPRSVAVSPVNGDLLVGDGTEQQGSAVDIFEPVAEMGGVFKFAGSIQGTPTGPAKELVGFGDIVSLAVDGNGETYVANLNGYVVDQFGPEGVYRGRLTGLPYLESLAVDPETHDLFISQGNSTLAVVGPSIAIPDVSVLPAEPVEATSATLRGVVNPDGNGEASCLFEFGTSTGYGEKLECAKHVADVNESVEQKVPATGLQPDTTYFYKLDATNLEDGKTNKGEGSEDEGTFTTPGPGLHGESVSEVSATTATLDATVDPHDRATSFYFQYSTESTAGCLETVVPSPCPGIPGAPGEAIGSTAGDQSVSPRLEGLTPATTYHYRVVVVSEAKPGVMQVFAEPDLTFTTQPTGSPASLPDGRQWELVTPPDKHGASPITGAAGAQAAVSGEAIAYGATLPTDEHAPGYLYNEQLLTTRGAGGWSTQDISLRQTVPAQLAFGGTYALFSEDLSLGLVEPTGEGFTSQEPDVFPPATERTPYLRHDLTCRSDPSTCFEPLLTGAPGYADVLEGTAFGLVGSPEEAANFNAAISGATPDLRHVVFHSRVDLTPGGGPFGMYEWSAQAPPSEQLQPVSVLPKSEGGGFVEGFLGSEPSFFGGASAAYNARRAISEDGSRVIWSNGYEGGQGQHLWLRDTVKHETVRLDGSAAGAGGAVFQIASSDDSRVFFTDNVPLVKESGLYECVIVEEAGELKCKLSELAPRAEVVGNVLGASEDGSYIYFVGNGVLGDGARHGARPGDCRVYKSEEAAVCNLYMLHYDEASGGWGEPVFIATLSGADLPDWGEEVLKQPVRVSPDGQWLAFMSQRSLTGYDNEDVSSAHPGERMDEEVYLYHASTGRLICASCNPTGARPHGLEAGPHTPGEAAVESGAANWEPERWLAGFIPGGVDGAYRGDVSRYQTRYLDDQGRLFFNANDALVPQAVNGNTDVYELEPAGVGGCAAGSSSYVQSEGGCLGLISPGTSADQSVFLDASQSGDDVFFLTAEKLVAQDQDGAYDVYDAHVCSAAVPCVSAPVPSPPCTTADACRGAPAPQPTLYGPGPTQTFSGPGNVVFAPPAPAARVQTRAQKLAQALKACHRLRKRDRRVSCERAARRRYASHARSLSARKGGRR
jgi:hypothetical protein